MPRNKDALIRYRVINRCLLHGKVASIGKLQQECELELGVDHVGKRTIQEDLRSMREDERLGYIAPIKFNRYRQGYIYEDNEYSIDNIPLNEEELEAIAFSATMLSQLRGVNIFDSFAGAARKIMDAVNVQRLMNEEAEYDFVQFEKVPYVGGSEFLQLIIDAIRNKIVLQISYKAFYSDQPKEVLVHPYLLKEYKHRWYLIGLNDELKELRTYALDRIQELVVKGKEYIDRNFDPKDYFKNTIGVIAPPGDPPEIIFSVRKPQAQYLVTLPLHESQEIIEEKKDEVIFRVKVHPTYELLTDLIAFRDELKVLEPEGLKEQFTESVRKTLERYS
ncbi:MAG: WYL domain-containing protein [Bacteroidales bacterium]|nr:WYL domain-containing protein [Bacteroidales bacterium]